jgi:hypothetical protein
VKDYLVTVCAACRTAACWHGEFLCERSAGPTIDIRASVLRADQREHPSNFSVRKVREVCGSVRYVP